MEKTKIKDMATTSAAIGAVFIVLSVGFHIMSCLCAIGDAACAKGCDIRFLVANILGIIGIMFGLGVFVYLCMKEKGRTKCTRKKH